MLFADIITYKTIDCLSFSLHNSFVYLRTNSFVFFSPIYLDRKYIVSLSYQIIWIIFYNFFSFKNRSNEMKIAISLPLRRISIRPRVKNGEDIKKGPLFRGPYIILVGLRSFHRFTLLLVADDYTPLGLRSYGEGSDIFLTVQRGMNDSALIGAHRLHGDVSLILDGLFGILFCQIGQGTDPLCTIVFGIEGDTELLAASALIDDQSAKVLSGIEGLATATD